MGIYLLNCRLVMSAYKKGSQGFCSAIKWYCEMPHKLESDVINNKRISCQTGCLMKYNRKLLCHVEIYTMHENELLVHLKLDQQCVYF